MSCMWIKDGSNFKFNSGQFSGLPTELPTISIFESSGLSTELPTELPTISIYGSSWPALFAWQNPQGHTMVLSQLSCPLSPYIEVVDSLFCTAKFPLAANSAAPWAAHFFIVGRCGLPSKLSTELPTFAYMEVVGSLICMAKFPRAAHGQPTPLQTCSPWAAKWAASLFFPYGMSLVTPIVMEVNIPKNWRYTSYIFFSIDRHWPLNGTADNTQEFVRRSHIIKIKRFHWTKLVRGKIK